MKLIGRYRNSGFEAVADGVMAFLIVVRICIGRESRSVPVVAMNPPRCPRISALAIDRSDLDAYALAEVIIRGCSPGSSVPPGTPSISLGLS